MKVHEKLLQIVKSAIIIFFIE